MGIIDIRTLSFGYIKFSSPLGGLDDLHHESFPLNKRHCTQWPHIYFILRHTYLARLQRCTTPHCHAASYAQVCSALAGIAFPGNAGRGPRRVFVRARPPNDLPYCQHDTTTLQALAPCHPLDVACCTSWRIDHERPTHRADCDDLSWAGH